VNLVVATLALAAFGHATLVELGENSFDAALKEHTYLFVFFTKANCTVCEGITPYLEAGAGAIKRSGLKTLVARVDVGSWDGAKVRFGLQGFPTSHYYLRGERMKVYLGSRDWMLKNYTWQKWLKQREHIVDSANIQEFNLTDFAPGSSQHQVVLEARVKKKSVRQKTVWQAMEALANYDAFEPKLVVQWLPKDKDPKKDARLRVHRMVFNDFDPETIIYNGTWSVNAIVKFAVQHGYHSLGTEFTLQKYGNFALEETDFDASVIALIDVKSGGKQKAKDDDDDDDDDDEGDVGNVTQAVLDNLKFLIPKYAKWRFTYEKFDKLTEKKKEMDLLGVVASTFEPSIFVLQGKKKFLLKGANSVRDLETVTGFFSSVLKGTARPDYLSEKDPEKERDKDGVLRLTGKNFPRYALDPQKDVFVLFTATGTCDKCDELEPEWKKLVKSVKGGVVLGKMEAMSNRCEEEFEGELPKLVLYPAVAANKKMAKRQVYRGEHRADLLLDFLVENTMNELKSDEL